MTLPLIEPAKKLSRKWLVEGYFDLVVEYIPYEGQRERRMPVLDYVTV